MRSVTSFILIFLMSFLMAQNSSEILVLNNLGKTVSLVNVEENTVDKDWLIVDGSETNTSPNDFLIYGGKLYIISSINIPTLKVFNLTSGGLEEEVTFGEYSNPYALTMAGENLFITMSGDNITSGYDPAALSAGPFVQTSTEGWVQDILFNGDKIFVVSTGNWGYDDGYVFVLDPVTGTKTDSIKTIGKNPTKLRYDENDGLYVLSSGVWPGDVDGGVVELYDPDSYELLDTIPCNAYLSDLGVNDNYIFVSQWGFFDVIAKSSHDTVYTSLSGGSDFYFDENGYLYTADFGMDSLYVYDQDMEKIGAYLVGDGPMVVLPYVEEANLIGDEVNLTKFMELRQNYPNPFNPVTAIDFTLTKAAHVKLVIYNSLGQKVTMLADDYLQAGYHQRIWDGKDYQGRSLSSGVYYYRLISDNEVLSKKMLLLK